jgi:hypothetical protein
MFKFKRAQGDFAIDILDEDIGWFDEEHQDEIGDFLIKAIKEEVAKDREKIGQLPDTKEFDDSFSFEVSGNEIIVNSNWPWIDQYVEGRPEFEMYWLTQEYGARFVPIHQKDGSVVVRMAPLTLENAWIHPGITRHTFIQRALDRTSEYIAQLQIEILMKNFENKS